MMKALFSLRFYAFLIMGEVTVKQGIAPSRIIQVQDVTFQYNGKKPCRVQLVLRHFKTQKMSELERVRAMETYALLRHYMIIEFNPQISLVHSFSLKMALHSLTVIFPINFQLQ